MELTHEQDVNPYFTEPPSTKTYKKVIKNLHTSAVQKVIENQIPNKVLNRRPPEINKTESTLSRRARSNLAQLRSGYSRKLNSYLHRLDKNIEDKCPTCSTSPTPRPTFLTATTNPPSLMWKASGQGPARLLNFSTLTAIAMKMNRSDNSQQAWRGYIHTRSFRRCRTRLESRRAATTLGHCRHNRA